MTRHGMRQTFEDLAQPSPSEAFENGTKEHVCVRGLEMRTMTHNLRSSVCVCVC